MFVWKQEDPTDERSAVYMFLLSSETPQSYLPRLTIAWT